MTTVDLSTDLSSLADDLDQMAKSVRSRTSYASAGSQPVMRAEAAAYERAARLVRAVLADRFERETVQEMEDELEAERYAAEASP